MKTPTNFPLIFLKTNQIFAFSIVSPVAYAIGLSSECIVNLLNMSPYTGDKAGTELRKVLLTSKRCKL